MQLSHLLFLIAATLSFSSIFITYHGFFGITKKFTQTTQSNILDPDNKSWFNQKTKVIMVLVDAFRFDYLTYNESLVGHEQFTYQNKFKKLHEIFTQSPELFTLLRARADPPTWTLAKVPGTVTGNIYLKAGMLQSTDAQKSTEDNVLHQLKVAGKRSYFSGDPLWTQYFPDDFVNYENVRGLDIKDFNVDNTIINNIKTYMKEDNFDLILAHLLGVDHLGHDYGLSDPKVGEQISRTDQWISEIIELMDDNTMLIMLGDHGMTPEGTHGGDSPEEMNTLIAAYHKKGFQKYQDNIHTSIMRSVNETLGQVKQQDLAPTLAMLLGVPIPFSNLGQILNDLYPGGQIQDKQGCQGTSFTTKMLDDNYLNTLQIMNYYKVFTDTAELLSQDTYHQIMSLSEETISAYKEARALAENGKQCEGSLFADKATAAIALGQTLSDKIYMSILTKPHHNMLIIIQGFMATFLVVLSYVLIIQYVYSHAYEKSRDQIKGSLKMILKGQIIPGLVTATIFLMTIVLNANLANFVTSTTLFLAFWLVGNISAHLFKLPKPACVPTIESTCLKKPEPEENQKELNDIENQKEQGSISLGLNFITPIEEQKKDFEAQPDSATSSPQLQNQRKFGLLSFTQLFKTMFFLKTPLISIIAVVLLITMVYYVQRGFHEPQEFAIEYSSLGALLTLGVCIAKLFTRRTVYFLIILVGYLIPMALIVKNNLIDLESPQVKMILGLLLITDWVFSETRYMLKKFEIRRVWACLHLLCFFIVITYQMINERESNLIEIILPRALWALVGGLCLLKLIFKVHRSVFVRNLQLYLFYFLLLLQTQANILSFAVTLTLMRITMHVFSRYSKPSNYLYSFLIVTQGYFGFFFLGQTDEALPKVFKAGFIGLHEFNPVFSSLMIFINVTTGLVLGMMFVSYYNQSIHLKALNKQFEFSELDESPEKKAEKDSVKISARVMKKRNIILYVFLVNIVYIGAVIRCLAWMKEFYWAEKARDKYIVDSFVYMFAMMWGGVVLAFE